MTLINEPKAFASLSSGLLARKGAAKPAMRPQGFGQMGASLDDLGWNDMGFEPPKPSIGAHDRDRDHDAFGQTLPEPPRRSPVSGLTPPPAFPATGGASPVHGQQADLEQQFGGDPIPVAGGPGEGGSRAHGPEMRDDQLHEVPPVSVAAEPVGGTSKAPSTPSGKPRIVAVRPAGAGADAAAVARPRAANGAGPKAAFTLRLDPQRHLKLRLACALRGRSAQMMVTEAVDTLLATYPELDNLAGQLPQGSRSRRAQG